MKKSNLKKIGFFLAAFLVIGTSVHLSYAVDNHGSYDIGGGCTLYEGGVPCSEIVGSYDVAVYQVEGYITFTQVVCNGVWGDPVQTGGQCTTTPIEQPAPCYRESSCGSNPTSGYAVNGVCDAPEPSEAGCPPPDTCTTVYGSDSCASVIAQHTAAYGSQETLFGYPSTYSEGYVTWTQQVCTVNGVQQWHWPTITSGGCSAPAVQQPPPPEQACSLPWGGSLSSGHSTSAYQASSVPYGSSCVSESRYCSNGSLSGSYQYGDCSVEAAPPTCGNGAINYAACNQCASGEGWNGSSCAACSNGGCSGSGGSSSSPLGSLVCNNGATNPLSCNLFVPTIGITLAPSAIQGVAVPMSWSSTNATSCSSPSLPSLSGTSGSIANISSILSPGNNVIGVSCSGAGGSSTSYASINVLVPSVDINASPTRVRSGNPSQVSWTTTNVTSCSVTGPGLSSTSLTGDQPVPITQQSTFQISCNGLTDSVTVNILPLFQEF